MEKLLLFKQVNGKIIPIDSNINRINSITNFDSKLPIAVISFIGEKGSGKTTYTRLLAQNFRNNSSNGWLQKVDINSTPRNKVQPLPGFTTKCCKNDNGESEISLWPEAFRIKIRGDIVMVLLLHLNISNRDVTPEDKDSLEFLLCLLSSRIVEINWRKDEFKFLKHYRDFKNDTRFQEHHEIICTNVIYLLRKHKSNKATVTKLNSTGHEAKRFLRAKMSCAEKREVLEELSFVGLTHVPDKRESFEKADGYLNLSVALYDAIYDCINCVADDESICTKYFPKKDVPLIGENLNEFFQTCVKVVNTKFGHHESLYDHSESKTIVGEDNPGSHYIEDPKPNKDVQVTTTNENKQISLPEEYLRNEVTLPSPPPLPTSHPPSTSSAPPPPPPPPPTSNPPNSQRLISRTATATKPTPSPPPVLSLKEILSRRSTLRKVGSSQKRPSKPRLTDSNPIELMDALNIRCKAMSGSDDEVPNGNDDVNELDQEWEE